MRKILHILAKNALLRCQRAATAVEYGLIISFVVLVMLVALQSVATKINIKWNHVSSEVTKY